MDVKFYTFSKNTNSTKRPETPDKVFPCELIDATSLMNPVITVVVAENPTALNYAYIPEFDRYYFVSDWTWYNGRWSAAMSEDVLASWKGTIGGQKQYILRAASDSDPDLIDTLYPTKPESKIIEESATTGAKKNYSNFLVQYVGSEGVHIAFMSDVRLTELCQDLWQSWGELTDMTELYKNVLDPFQYIPSVMTTRMDVGFFGVQGEGWTMQTMKPGDISLPSAESKKQAILAGTNGKRNIAIKVPKHPGAASHPYLKSAMYSSYSIRIPGVGWIQLPAADLYNETEITVSLEGEPFTGKLRAQILNSAGKIIAQGDGLFAVPWALSKSSPNVLGAVSGGISAVASAASAVMAPSPVSVLGAVSGIANAVSDLTPTYAQSGSFTGSVGLADDIILQLRYQEQVEPDPVHRGNPVCKSDYISNQHGYVMTADAALDLPATDSEVQKIKALMDGGFYFE